MKRLSSAQTPDVIPTERIRIRRRQPQSRSGRLAFRIISVALALAFVSASAQTIQFEGFTYGPYDYTDPQHYRERLPIVEEYHFNSDVENLRNTMSGGTIGSHLLYVIRSFPNHHRALVSFSRLWERSGAPLDPPPGVGPQQSPDYLYRRAIEFAPADGMVKLLYAIYLVNNDRRTDAIPLLDQAAELESDNADVNYNLGLMYLKLGQHEKASAHGTRAYEMGHPLPGLRKKMIAAGIWEDGES